MDNNQHQKLVDELTIEIGNRIEAKIESLVEPRFQRMEKSLDALQKTVNRIDTDMGGDRKDIGDMKISMGAIKNEFSEIRDMFSKQTRTIVSKVEDTINEGIESASEMMTESVAPSVEGVLENFVATKPKIFKKRGVAKTILSWIGFK